MSIDHEFIPEILCIYGSPRAKGNTDLLMDAFVKGVEAAGGKAGLVYLRKLNIAPCKEIYACKNKGKCAINDEMTPLYGDLMLAHAIALASPVMFYAMSAQTKAFIDRCQAVWCMKHYLNMQTNLSPLNERKGVLLSVGGSTGQKIFDGMLLTFKYFLEPFDAKLWKWLGYRGIDAKGDIMKRPDALAEAEALGRELVEAVRNDAMDGR